jgi:hypothetical protein
MSAPDDNPTTRLTQAGGLVTTLLCSYWVESLAELWKLW